MNTGERLWWLVHFWACSTWILGLLLHSYIIYAFGLGVLLGNFFGWFAERFNK